MEFRMILLMFNLQRPNLSQDSGYRTLEHDSLPEPHPKE